MHSSAIFKLLGIFLMLFSITMVPPIFIAIGFNEINNDLNAFLIGFILTLCAGMLFWFPFRKDSSDLKKRDGFFVVALLWIIISFFGAIPFYLYFFPKITIVDALFEVVSGLTTTGASVLSNIDELPRGIIYYRQQLHFIGGLGVILLAVAVLPILGIGGMELYRAEIASSLKSEMIHPRLKTTAKWLWFIYTSLVALCILFFWLAGMPLFDAIGESFSAVATGGFSMHDTSYAYYNSHLINVIAIIFMLLGSINFNLHFQFIHKRNISVYLADEEFRTFIKLIFFSSIIFAMTLLVYHSGHLNLVFFNSLFNTVSMSTTTGFTINDLSQWPSFIPIFIMFITIIGGCGASAAGGLKVIRCLLLKKQASTEIQRLIHPQGYFPVKLNAQIISDPVLNSVWGFFGLYLIIFIIFFLMLYASGLDGLTSFSSLATCFSNAGTGFGGVVNGFGKLNNTSKWVLILAMLLGRLEITTLLVLCTPAYWRK